MNNKRIIVLVAAVVVFVFGVGVAAAQNNARGGQGGGGQGNGYQGGRNAAFTSGLNSGGGFMLKLPAASTNALPPEVVDLMLDGWLDEQHAAAVYQAVVEQFGAVRPFTNIQRSEIQHIAAWETLFVRYGIAVPAVPTFDVPAFASVSEACAVGAEAEVANFDLYDTMLEAFAPYPDLLYVAQSLRDASEFSHLPAFENCAGY